MLQNEQWSYDFEIFENLLMLSAVRMDDPDIRKSFIVWQNPYGGSENELEEMVSWLKTDNLELIGYNCVKFDYQIAHFLMQRMDLLSAGASQVILETQQFIQEMINSPFPPVPQYEMLIPQRDVFLIHHFDNKNKAVSLKALQIAMHWHNVMDMPFDFRDTIFTREDVEKVREYNFNDCLSTREFYLKSLDIVKLREGLSEKYNLNLLNANDAKIGQEIILLKIAKHMGLPVSRIRKMRTNRDYVAIKDCILPYVKDYLGKEFLKAYDKFQTMVLDNTGDDDDDKKDKKYGFSVLYDDLPYDFGVGGLHAVRPSGVYEEDENFIIISADVTSYYPNLSLQNSFAPEQFGIAFLLAYQEVYNERTQYKKGTPENYGLKIALNGTYGKSKDKFSPLYDPKFTMQITVNGQLLLALLAQMVTDAGARVIMANTDGIEIFCPREREQEIRQIMEQWSWLTKMPLEYKQYKKMFIRDVNNYIGVYMDGKTYNKGAYEWENVAWHKDHSMLIVPEAVENYLVRGISLEESFRKADFKKFYIGKRAKTGGKFEVRTVVGEGIEKTKLNKTVRYLIAKRGGYLYKHQEGEYVKTRSTKLDAPWKVFLAMREPEPSVKDNIDFRYYRQKAIDLMKPILNAQLSAVEPELTKHVKTTENREVQTTLF